MLDVIVVLIALSAGVGARRSIPISRVLVTASMGLAVVVDATYSQSVDVDGGDGTYVDVGWVLQACLICLAAVIALRHRERQGADRTLPGRWTMYLVYAALLGCSG